MLLFLVLASVAVAENVYIQFDPLFPPIVKATIKGLLAPFNASELDPSAPISSAHNGWVLGFGSNISFCSGAYSLPQTTPEAFQVVYNAQNGLQVLCAEGNPIEAPLFDGKTGNGGRVFAAMNLLQTVGFSFFHPLSPGAPVEFMLPADFVSGIIEKPFWPIRGSHYHSEHPLDLTEFLQGLDSVDQTWEQMQNEFALYLAWLTSHKVNRLEFVLLCSAKNESDCMNSGRLQRYQTICGLAHQFGVAVLADIAMAIKQQNAQRLILDASAPISAQLASIRSSVDWAMKAFDGISTEAGTSEFTATACQTSLLWYNELASYVATNYPNSRTYIKMHVSTGQSCTGYASPIAPVGKPINFNFLPVFANLSLGVYPHTVQFYTLNDPTSGSYGNANFSDILDIGLYSANQKRETIFFPENSYWINFDINVPLGLAPVYAYRALDDIRTVANRQNASAPFAGTFLFESGWEYGYWLSAVAHYEGSWNPQLQATSTAQALALSLRGLDRHFGSGWAAGVAEVGENMRWPLIYGVESAESPNISSTIKMTGIAYLQGWDTWSELSQTFGFAEVQPEKQQFYELQKFPFFGPKFSDLISMFNQTMFVLEQSLLKLAGLRASSFASSNLTQESIVRVDELVDTANITFQRARQVYALLLVAHTGVKGDNWQNAEDALVNAQEIVLRREMFYNTARISAWRPNPTSYHFTYLWAAKSLFFFWRDRTQLLNASLASWTPCLMNIQDPVEVAFGEGTFDNVMKILRELIDRFGSRLFGECLSAPSSEPIYPRDAH